MRNEMRIAYVGVAENCCWANHLAHSSAFMPETVFESDGEVADDDIQW